MLRAEVEDLRYGPMGVCSSHLPEHSIHDADHRMMAGMASPVRVHIACHHRKEARQEEQGVEAGKAGTEPVHDHELGQQLTGEKKVYCTAQNGCRCSAMACPRP